MKTETNTDWTLITARTTALGAARALSANGGCALVCRDGVSRHIESARCRRETGTVVIYVVTGPADLHEDGDGSHPTDRHEVSMDRPVVVEVMVHAGKDYQARIARIQTILRS